MIHVVFQEADVSALQKSFALDESLQSDIIQIKDDFAVGPIGNTFSEEETKVRKKWWREVLAGGDYDGTVDSGKVDDPKTVSELIERLNNNAEEIVWLWVAQNKHDISGYYWLVS